MSTAPAAVSPMAQRIHALHEWYCTNVMPFPLTPEVERLWMAFFNAGYNGHQLAQVVRYLRGEIRREKRNPGCLRLANLLTPDETGVIRFASDLGFASVKLTAERKSTPVPDGEIRATPAPRPGAPLAVPPPPGSPEITPEMRAARVAELERLKRDLTGGIRDVVEPPVDPDPERRLPPLVRPSLH